MNHVPSAADLPPENIFGHTKKLRYILDVVERSCARNPATRVLDFGCGNGTAVSQYVIASLPRTAHYVGVDMHDASVAHANRLFGGGNATFSGEEPDGRFDVVIYADVLEHLADPVLSLERHGRKLSPGGVIVGSIPNGWGPFEIESAVDRKLGLSAVIAKVMAKARGDTDAVPYNSESGHVQFFGKSSFTRTVAAAGLTLVDFRNGVFFGAMLSERILRLGGAPLMRGNGHVADALPSWAVSTWLFTCEAAR